MPVIEVKKATAEGLVSDKEVIRLNTLRSVKTGVSDLLLAVQCPPDGEEESFQPDLELMAFLQNLIKMIDAREPLHDIFLRNEERLHKLCEELGVEAQWVNDLALLVEEEETREDVYRMIPGLDEQHSQL